MSAGDQDRPSFLSWSFTSHNIPLTGKQIDFQRGQFSQLSHSQLVRWDDPLKTYCGMQGEMLTVPPLEVILVDPVLRLKGTGVEFSPTALQTIPLLSLHYQL